MSLIVRSLTFLILLIAGCSQIKLPDMGSSSPLIDLKSLPGVQATDIRMIDNDFNTSGVMTHHIAQGIELGDSILYNSEDAAKSTWAVVALPETRIVRRIQVYSKNLVHATVILSDGKTSSCSFTLTIIPVNPRPPQVSSKISAFLTKIFFLVLLLYYIDLISL